MRGETHILFFVMAKVHSNELVQNIQAEQRNAIAGMHQPPHLAVVRFHDPARYNHYRPTASYAAQIRSHAARIGAGSSEYVVTPESRLSPAQVVRRLGHMGVTGVMPLYPLPDVAAVKAELRAMPHLDTDDVLALRNRAPTARAMIAMANLSLHGMNYSNGRTLDELSVLNLPDDRPASKIRFGGEGQLTGKPLRQILHGQGIDIFNVQVAGASTPQRLSHLPTNGLIFTATPVAEQIKNANIPDNTVIVDAGFGIIDGDIRGNTEQMVADRESVLWTPPREGVGPVSTAYLFHHLIEAAGVDPPSLDGLPHDAIDEKMSTGFTEWDFLEIELAVSNAPRLVP